MPHRYFSTNKKENRIFLTPQDAHHFCVVMRGRVNESILVCNGKGTDYICRAVTCSPDQCELEIISSHKNVSEPSIQATIYIGYPKSEKLDWIIQKSVELGAVEIVPFFSRLCVVTPKKEEQKNIRYNRIALEAAKQAGRGVIPQVHMPLSFEEMLKQAVKSDRALFCYEQGGIALHSQFDPSVQTVAIITGSEGGFTEQEAQCATDAGCTIIGLGPRILRCETAPLTALSVIMAQTGNLQ